MPVPGPRRVSRADAGAGTRQVWLHRIERAQVRYWNARSELLELVDEALSDGVPAAVVADHLGVSASTVYRHLSNTETPPL